MCKTSVQALGWGWGMGMAQGMDSSKGLHDTQIYVTDMEPGKLCVLGGVSAHFATCFLLWFGRCYVYSNDVKGSVKTSYLFGHLYA